MPDVIDIIHRLSYEIGDASGLERPIKKLQEQADKIDRMKEKLSDLQKYYDTSENVQQQQYAKAAIDKTTQAIDLQTQALQKQFNSNKQIQAALNEELGLLEHLSRFIKQHTAEMNTLTDTAKIKEYAAQIKAARTEMAALVGAIPDIRNTGAIEALQQRMKILNSTIPTLPKGDIAAAAKELERVKTQLKDLQSIGKEPIINIRQVGAIEALQNKITILKNTLKTVPKENIAAINVELEKTQKQLAAVESQGKPQQSGILAGLFGGNGGSLGKQVLTGALLGLGIGGGMGLITRAVSGLVDFASAELDAVAKAEKLAKANEALEKSFEALGDEIAQANKEFEILSDVFHTLRFPDQEQDGYEKTTEAIKRKAEALKALGAVNGEVGNFELKQLEAEQEVRKSELKDLGVTKQAYTDVYNTIAAAQAARAEAFEKGGVKLPFGDSPETKAVLGIIKNSNLPGDTQTKIITDIKKQTEEGVDLYTALAKAATDYQFKLTEVHQKEANKQAEIDNAEVERQAKLRIETYNKTKELNLQLQAEEENYRQLKEKEDIQSVDRIVKDTAAKYKTLYNAIYRSAVDEAKKFPGFDEKNPLANLPAPIRDKYNALFGDNRRAQAQDTANLNYEFAQGQYNNLLSGSSALSTSGAGILKAANDYGLPSYDALSAALDKETAAKKEALHTQFVAQASAITDSTLVIEAQNQYDAKLLQIDNDAYKSRLDLADQYYSKLAQKIQNASAIVALQIDTDLANSRAAILSAGGSRVRRDRRLQRAGLLSDMSQQQNIASAQDQMLPSLQTNKDNSALALEYAKGTGDEAAAQVQYDKDAKAYEEATNKKAHAAEKYQEDITALHELEIKQKVELIDLTQQVADTAVRSYEIIAQARQKDLDREVQVRTQRVDMAEKLAERGNTTALAQEQKALEASNQARRSAALQEQEINAALTVSNALLAVAKAAVEGGGFASIATIAAVIAALGVGFAEAEALNASSKQNFKGGVVNFRGKGGPQDDANPVNISSGESVITAAATAKYGPMLEAMNKGLPVFAAPPTMAPLKTMLPNEHYATKEDFRELKAAIDYQTDVMAGKEVHIAQLITKQGIHQIVKEETKAHANQWRA